ncbi:MAG: hypothetical protein BWK77_00400, partial [Verrucomicrobia bacterium A1]
MVNMSLLSSRRTTWAHTAARLSVLCVFSLASAPAPFAAAAVVVSEVMYDPVGGGTNEFVELRNSGTNSVSLTGWYFADGITYTFAAGTVLPAGGYLAIAANRAAFQLRYPAVTNLAIGAFNGQLEALAKPHAERTGAAPDFEHGRARCRPCRGV